MEEIPANHRGPGACRPRAHGPGEELAAPRKSVPGKPDILVIWGDDIGYWNISHNNHGMMGYETPNIDRIAREGVAFPTTTRAELTAGPTPSI